GVVHLGHPQALFAVGGGQDLVAGRLEVAADEPDDARLVVDDQNGGLLHSESSCDWGAGSAEPPGPARTRLKRKALPTPGCDSTQMRPPCISSMPWQIESPSPVPPALRTAVPSAR